MSNKSADVECHTCHDQDNVDCESCGGSEEREFQRKLRRSREELHCTIGPNNTIYIQKLTDALGIDPVLNKLDDDGETH